MTLLFSLLQLYEFSFFPVLNVALEVSLDLLCRNLLREGYDSVLLWVPSAQVGYVVLFDFLCSLHWVFICFNELASRRLWA